jgi:hypothetical protein
MMGGNARWALDIMMEGQRFFSFLNEHSRERHDDNDGFVMPGTVSSRLRLDTPNMGTGTGPLALASVYSK